MVISEKKLQTKKEFIMKKALTLSLLFGISLSITQAQNVGINTDGSSPDADALLHLNNHSASSLDASLLRIENSKNSTNNLTGLEFFNSATGATAQWKVYIPASGSTDLRFRNNVTDLITLQNDGDVGIGTTTPASGLDINTSMGLKLTTITAATSLDQTHNVVLCNTGPYTVTLPAAASNAGKVYYIKNIDADGELITIDANNSETIDGALNFYLNTSKHSIRIISDGTNWHVLEESGRHQAAPSPENCDGSLFTWADVINPTTGAIWMDRNLGASQVATSSTDADSYGDLYQWGRGKDGHQCRNSGTTSTLSTTDIPGHGDFIESSSNKWLNSPNLALWQGVNGINNPCPNGYRVPTQAEWTDEANSWSTNNAAGAFASPLKLTLTGGRAGNNGSLFDVGTYGHYYSSTNPGYRYISFHSTNSTSYANQFANYAHTVRCIKG